MSAANDPKAPRTGDYRFAMKQAIPAYLFALCVGDLEFQAIGPRTAARKAVTLNAILNIPVALLADGDSRRTDILHEYFLPPERFADFLAA